MPVKNQKKKCKVIHKKKIIKDDSSDSESDNEVDVKNESDNDSEDDDKKVKVVKRTLIEKLIDNLKEDEKNITETKKEIQKMERELHKIERKRDSRIKSLENAYDKMAKKIREKKEKMKNNSTGIMRKIEINGKLADWLGVDEDTKLSRPEINSLIWKVMKEKDMIYEDDGRVFVIDKNTAKLFGISSKGIKSRDHNDKEGLNFSTLGKAISYAINNS
tara:strand:+ start:279 stop:932 length:654 start_codon:yes stop_codon:yes gene_type:complete